MKKLLLILLFLPLFSFGQIIQTSIVNDSISYQYLIESTTNVGTWKVVHVADDEYGLPDNNFYLDYYIEIYKINRMYQLPEYFLVTIRRSGAVCQTSVGSHPNLENSPIQRLIRIADISIDDLSSDASSYLVLENDWNIYCILNITEEMNIKSSSNRFTSGYGKQIYVQVPQENKTQIFKQYLGYQD
jgi:hypothetical protein